MTSKDQEVYALPNHFSEWYHCGTSECRMTMDACKQRYKLSNLVPSASCLSDIGM